MNTIQMYINKIHSSLQGGGSVHISSFMDEHANAKPLLHARVRSERADVTPLVYVIKRLPKEIFSARTILMGQSDKVFESRGFMINDSSWYEIEQQTARLRKRKYQKKSETIAVYVISISDVEDSITMLTAFYIEVLKINRQMKQTKKSLASCFSTEDFEALQKAAGDFMPLFEAFVANPIDYEIILLAGAHVDFSKSVHEWWLDIASNPKRRKLGVLERPIYFISSNTHSIINPLSGYPIKRKEWLFKNQKERVGKDRAVLESEQVPEENIAYYLSRYAEEGNPLYRKQKKQFEEANKMYRIEPHHNLDLEAQIFTLADCVKNKEMDRRIKVTPAMKKRLAKSDALIVNTMYPLGMGAYHILREISEQARDLRGIYIMGKAASLNATVGDIAIPSSVRDLHTKNNVYLHNVFSPASFEDYIKNKSVLTEQKALTVRGTFLQNEAQLLKNFDDGFTIVEMELGPYMNRLYELVHPERYPLNESYVIKPNFRLGIAYYISDTPHKKGLNLGAQLAWGGINSTYAISLGILSDIFQAEYHYLIGSKKC